MDRLITIGPSHYCEKARWALDRARLSYTEEAHYPMFSYLSTLGSGGRRTAPVLVSAEGVLGDSRDILEYADRRSAGSIYGATGRERREAKELEAEFDRMLGPHTRRLAYYHLINERTLIESSFGQGVKLSERLAFRAAFPVIRSLMVRGLELNRPAAERSRARVLKVFASVEERLRDGRLFLTGDHFTAADLTFAALAAPVICPEEYGYPLPTLDEFPRPAADEARRMRDTEAGRFALQLYRSKRKTPYSLRPPAP